MGGIPAVEALLTGPALAVLLVFARVGSALIFLPGFGESFVPVRFRLLFAMILALTLHPVIPPYPEITRGALFLLGPLALEVTIGFWIGLTARVLMTALQFAGYQIGMVSGLSNAFAPDAAAFQGGTILSSAMILSGVALIFATDFHHVMIDALLMSYEVFPVGQIIPEDLADQIVRAAGASVYMGVSIAAPFFIMTLLLNLAMGLANRMMPTMPVFFVASPILIGFVLLAMIIASPSMLRGFLSHMADWFGSFTF
jgi:flagellar biosynthesis protein FliR